MSKATEWVRRLIRVTPHAPLLLGNQSGIGNFQETADFIPGNALRGAVAGRLLAQCTQEAYLEDHAHCPDRAGCSFWQVFGAMEPRFGPANPGKFGPVWPLPLTARTCKRHPGWPGSGKKAGHGIIDTLFADFVYDLISDPTFPQRTLLQPELGAAWSAAWQPALRETYDACQFAAEGGPKCGQAMKPLPGQFYAWDGRPQPAYAFTRNRATHVGINRARGVAQDELLFTQDSLIKSADAFAFFAEVDVPAARQAALDEALLGRHFVGRGRSRGLGAVEITLENEPDFPSLASRLQDFSITAAAQLRPYRAQDGRVQTSLPGQLFSLTCRTPAILSDGGRPLRVPQLSQLGLPDGVFFLRAWARAEVVGGWDGAARLPRRTQMAVRAGSVFLYFAPQSVDTTQLTAALARIEQDGIGEAQTRARGYGRVTVCAPFHVMMSRR